MTRAGIELKPNFDFLALAYYHRALMQTALPDRIVPRRLCDRGESMTGSIPVSALQRLCELLHAPEGEVRVRLYFRRDNSGQAYVRLRYEAVLALPCQRCLQAVHWPLKGDNQLQPVGGDDAARDVDEPLLVGADGIDPRAMVEDEMILALPLVPRHPDSAHCMPDNPAAESRQAAGDNPFEALRQLKS
jgi:uncharacterized protein